MMTDEKPPTNEIEADAEHVDENKEVVPPVEKPNALQLKHKYYTRLDDLLQFLYPSHTLHSKNATLRLFVYAEYGPLYNHHSYHQCLCPECKDKCKDIRKENETAKQLYYGKILIGDKQLSIEDETLSWLCEKCKQHCCNAFHLKSGAKNLHIVSDSELCKMEMEIQRKDLLSCFVSKKEELQNPLTVEEEEELIQRQPLRVKHVPNLTKEQTIELFSKLPTYKVHKAPIESAESKEQEPTVDEAADENKDDNEQEKIPETSEVESKGKDKKKKKSKAKKEEPVPKAEEPADVNEEAEDAEQEQNKEEIVEEQAEQEVDEGEEMLSFYDISAVVRRVRAERKKDLLRRSVTTQDKVKNGPKNRSKSAGSTALKYTQSKRYKLAECQFSDALTGLLHTYTHEIATLNTASETNITQNIRLLRYLEKDSETNWDSTCCFSKSP